MHWCLHLCTWIYGSSLSNFGWLDFLSDVTFVSFTEGCFGCSGGGGGVIGN